MLNLYLKLFVVKRISRFVLACVTSINSTVEPFLKKRFNKYSRKSLNEAKKQRRKFDIRHHQPKYKNGNIVDNDLG